MRAVLDECGVRLTGHFRLTSGRHSGEYWEKFRLFAYPRLVERLCGEIARTHRDSRIDVVMGPTTGGVILAYELARQLGVRAAYAETQDGRRQLRRGQTLDRGTRMLIVDDVLTMGSSVRDCVKLAAEHGSALIGVCVLIDRSGGSVDVGAPLEALLTVSAETYDAADCPLCAQGVPINEPGSAGRS